MFLKEKFIKCVYFGQGSGSGASAADPKAIGDVEIMPIEAGTVIESVKLMVTTALAGTTQLDVGDDDDPNGFIAAATLTDGAITNSNGAYLQSADYKLNKFYEAAKTMSLDNTTANTGGAFVVVVQGFKV